MRRQRFQRRLVELLEPVPSASVELFERASVQVLQQDGDGLIERMQAEELLMPQPRHDPALDHLHRDLCLGFVLRLARSRREHDGAVMLGALQRGAVQARLVTVGPGNQGARIVRDDHFEIGRAHV